jgi:hypothetical protein
VSSIASMWLHVGAKNLSPLHRPGIAQFAAYAKDSLRKGNPCDCPDVATIKTKGEYKIRPYVLYQSNTFARHQHVSP